MSNPVLSVVVAIASDTLQRTNTRHLEPCLEALQAQADTLEMEIIVPLPPGVVGIEGLRRRFPQVRLLECADLRKYSPVTNSREHHGELISRGFHTARGSIVALIEDHDVPAPDWSACLLRAHREPFAAVGGAIENGIDRPLNWAVYFSDFQLYQNPLPRGESKRASDANSSYRRTALERVRHAWDKEFHEAQVNEALDACGQKLALDPDVVVYQRRQGLRLIPALRERFVWGRSFGAWRCTQPGRERRSLWILFSPLLPALLMLRRTRTAIVKRRHLGAFLKAFPLTSLLTMSWSCGELTGYITQRAVS